MSRRHHQKEPTPDLRDMLDKKKEKKKKKRSIESTDESSGATRRDPRMYPPVRHPSPERDTRHPKSQVVTPNEFTYTSTDSRRNRRKKQRQSASNRSVSPEAVSTPQVEEAHSSTSRRRSPSDRRSSSDESDYSTPQGRSTKPKPSAEHSIEDSPPSPPDERIVLASGEAVTVTVLTGDTPGTKMSKECWNAMAIVYNQKIEESKQLKAELKKRKAQHATDPSGATRLAVKHSEKKLRQNRALLEKFQEDLGVTPTAPTAGASAGSIGEPIPIQLDADASLVNEASADQMEVDEQLTEEQKRIRKEIEPLTSEQRHHVAETAMHRFFPVHSERKNSIAEQKRMEELIEIGQRLKVPSNMIKSEDQRDHARRAEVAAYITNYYSTVVPFMSFHIFVIKFLDAIHRNFGYHPGSTWHLEDRIFTLGPEAPETFEDADWTPILANFIKEAPDQPFSIDVECYQHTGALTITDPETKRPIYIPSAKQLRKDYGQSEWKTLLSIEEFYNVIGKYIEATLGHLDVDAMVKEDRFKGYKGTLPRMITIMNSKGSYMKIDLLQLGGIPRQIIDFLQDPTYVKLMAGGMSTELTAIVAGTGYFGKYLIDEIAHQWGFHDVTLTRRARSNDDIRYNARQGWIQSLYKTSPDLQNVTVWEAMLLLATGHLPEGDEASTIKTMMALFGLEYGPQKKRYGLDWLLGVPKPSKGMGQDEKITRYLLLDALAPFVLHFAAAALFPHLHATPFVPQEVIRQSQVWVDRFNNHLQCLLPIATYHRFIDDKRPLELNETGHWHITIGAEECTCKQPRCVPAQLEIDLTSDMETNTDSFNRINQMGINIDLLFPCNVGDRPAERTDPIPIFQHLAIRDIKAKPIDRPVKVPGMDPTNAQMYVAKRKSARRQQEEDDYEYDSDQSSEQCTASQPASHHAKKDDWMIGTHKPPRAPAAGMIRSIQEAASIQQPSVDVSAAPKQPYRDVTKSDGIFEHLNRRWTAKVVQQVHDHIYDKDHGRIVVHYHEKKESFKQELLEKDPPVILDQDIDIAIVQRIDAILKYTVDPQDGEVYHPLIFINFPSNMEDIQAWGPPPNPWPRQFFGRLPKAMVSPAVLKLSNDTAHDFGRRAEPLHQRAMTPEEWNDRRRDWYNEQLHYVQHLPFDDKVNAEHLDFDHQDWYAYMVLVIKAVMYRSGETPLIKVQANRAVARINAQIYTPPPHLRHRPLDSARRVFEQAKDETRYFEEQGNAAALKAITRVATKVHNRIERYQGRVENEPLRSSVLHRGATYYPSSERSQSGASSTPYQSYNPNPKAHIPLDAYWGALAEPPTLKLDPNQIMISLRLAVKLGIDWLIQGHIIVLPRLLDMTLAGARLCCRLDQLSDDVRPVIVTIDHPMGPGAFDTYGQYMHHLQNHGLTQYGLFEDPKDFDPPRAAELELLRQTTAFRKAGEINPDPNEYDGRAMRSPYLALAKYHESYVSRREQEAREKLEQLRRERRQGVSTAPSSQPQKRPSPTPQEPPTTRKRFRFRPTPVRDELEDQDRSGSHTPYHRSSSVSFESLNQEMEEIAKDRQRARREARKADEPSTSAQAGHHGDSEEEDDPLKDVE